MTDTDHNEHDYNDDGEAEAMALCVIADALDTAVQGIWGERAGCVLIVTIPQDDNESTRMRVATNLCPPHCAAALSAIAEQYPARHGLTRRDTTP